MKLWALIQEAAHIGTEDYTDILWVPEHLDIKMAKKEWDEWYRDWYCSDGKNHDPRFKYKSFIDFLKEQGAMDPPDSVIQEFRY